jgi:Fe-S-cluster containining protein
VGDECGATLALCWTPPKTSAFSIEYDSVRSDRKDGGMAHQPGFFDTEERLPALSAKGDALEKLGNLVDFEHFRSFWNVQCRGRIGPKGGVPPFDHVLMFKIDCLTCANCCKTTSPIFYQKDIERASKALKLKPGTFIEKYLRLDEDNDYVLQVAPCPFLNPDNYCGIYDDRPNACREYPHTDRKKIQQILDLTFKNTLVCPAVLRITEEAKRKLKL